MQIENAAAPAADDRTSMLAELRNIERGAPPPAAAPPPSEEPPSSDAVGAPAPAGEAQELSADDGADEDDADVEETAPEPAKVDPETARRLSQVQKQEKRAREGLAAERRAFEEERERWREETRGKTAAVASFEKMKERARLDLASVVKELGIAEEDFEYHAEQLYRRSPKGMKDPRHKALAEQSMREREQADRIARLEKQLEEDRTSRSTAETRAAQVRAATEYMGKVTKAAGADAPLVRGMITKNPERAQRRLGQVALELSRDLDGDIPDPAEVVKALEADLREWGLTPPASSGTDNASNPATKAGGPKSKNPGAGEQKRPQPKQQASESRPAPEDPEQLRSEIVRAMKEGTFSDD